VSRVHECLVRVRLGPLLTDILQGDVSHYTLKLAFKTLNLRILSLPERDDQAADHNQ
jgi:hypothetical protein